MLPYGMEQKEQESAEANQLAEHGDLDHYQNLITSSFYHPRLLHKIS